MSVTQTLVMVVRQTSTYPFLLLEVSTLSIQVSVHL